MEPLTMIALGSLGASAIGSIWNGYQSKKTSNRNYDIQKEQLNYQKYLNNNQIQMQVADAQKAGINPLAMNGTGNLTAGSYSNVETPEMDLSAINGITSLAIQEMANKNAQIIADKQAESAKDVAQINAQSAETQTQMKIDADTETQNNQQLWQTLENVRQRMFEENENRLGRENAKKIADNANQTMKDITTMNNNLQKWINTYQPIIQGNGKDMAIDGDENGKINILSAQQYTVQRQLEEMITRTAIDGNYKAQLLQLQDELKDLQKKATDAGVTQGYINSISGALNSVGNLINSIGSFGKPGAIINNTGNNYKTTNIGNLYGN